jgi:hypothetical protein
MRDPKDLQNLPVFNKKVGFELISVFKSPELRHSTLFTGKLLASIAPFEANKAIDA